MRKILLLASVVLCLAVSTAFAQDVIAVAGGAETHKVLVDNEQVRVLDVHIKPGQKIGMHSHPANVVYFDTDGKMKVTYPDGKTEERDLKAGTAVSRGPLTHAVENVGNAEIHLVQTEMKGTAK